MLSTKEITERFEVSRATLHNWKSTKPNLCNLLQTADEQFSKYRDVNILLDRYIQTVQNIEIFEYKELEYILELKLENPKIEELDNFHLKFIENIVYSLFDTHNNISQDFLVNYYLIYRY